MEVGLLCGVWWGFLWVLAWAFFVFCEACPPLPMGEGPGERSGFGEFFVFVLGFLWGWVSTCSPILTGKMMWTGVFLRAYILSVLESLRRRCFF